ncbi:MAG: MATE family efflux transporter [Phycisphaerales bacterium]|nr:MATE family efflux transporter [Phycisphaerales bacterium]
MPPRPPENLSPLRELLRQAAPAMAAMASYTAMQFVDARMVAELGPRELAAQGNGGIAAWFAVSTTVGVLFAVNTFVAQNLGANRPERCAAYAWTALWMGLIAWLVMLPYAAALGPVFAWMHAGLADPTLIRLETDYARITLAGALFTLWARALGQFFYGVHRPIVVLASAVAANLLNVFLNYALIFGHFGAPALGVHGAALGTVLAGVLEFAIPMALFLSPRFNADYHTRRAWRWSGEKVRDILRIGWPGGVQTGNEMFCWWLFMAWLVGSFGAAHNAAGWIGLRWMTVGFMPAFGLSQAVTAVVGRQIGRGDHDAANHRAWLGVRVAMVYMGAWAAVMVVFRAPMTDFFVAGDASPETRAEVVRVGSAILVCCAVFQLFDALGIVLMGALRGAGDTVWPGVVTMILSWTLILALGYAFIRFAPQLGGIGPWIAATAYIVALGLAMCGRWMGGRWRTIRLVEPSSGPAEPTPNAAPDPAPAPGPA